jgi:O-antigen/teichoic acid export membrane protein
MAKRPMSAALQWLRARFKNRALVNTAIYLSTSVLSKGVSVLLIPLYTARLSPSAYGAYGLAQTFYWVLPSIATLSLSSAFARFFFDERDPALRDRRLAAIATPIILLAVIGAILGEALLATSLSARSVALDTTSLRIVIWTCAAVAIGEIPSAYLRAAQQAMRYALYNLTTFALTAGSTAFFLLRLDLGLRGLLGGMLFGQAAGALISIVFTARTLGFRLDRVVFKEAVRYSAPLIPHTVGTSLMGGVDRWALEHYGFRDGLGQFTLAYQLTLPMQLASNAWNEASSPTFLGAWRDGGDVAARRALRGVVTGFLVASGGMLLCVMAALPVLRLFIRPAYHDAFTLVPLIGLTLVVGTLFSAFINVLFVKKNTTLIPILTLASVGIVVGFNALLVPRYGVYGAIAATGIAFACRTFLMYVFAQRELRIPSALSTQAS